MRIRHCLPAPAILLVLSLTLAGAEARAQEPTLPDTTFAALVARVSAPPTSAVSSTGAGAMGSVNSGIKTFNTVKSYAQGALAVYQAIEAIKQLSAGGVQGCDYIGYLQVGQNLGSNLSAFPGIGNAKRKIEGWKPPASDYFAKFIHRMRNSADETSADAELRSTVSQLEKVCHATTQLDQNKVVQAIVYSGDKGIGEVIETLFSQTQLVQWLTSGRDTTRTMSRFAMLYEQGTPLTQLPEDTLHVQTIQTLRRALGAANSVLDNLAQLDTAVNELQEDYYLKATPDTAHAGQWTCPPGYPDPNKVTLAKSQGRKTKGYPICGGALPEQSVMVLARAEAFLLQLKGLETTLGAADIDLGATRLSHENLKRQESWQLFEHRLRIREF